MTGTGMEETREINSEQLHVIDLVDKGGTSIMSMLQLVKEIELVKERMAAGASSSVPQEQYEDSGNTEIDEEKAREMCYYVKI